MSVSYVTWRRFAIFPLRSWNVGEEALKMFQAQVCSMACTERVHWTVNNDINVWQIKWLVNNLLTALTSEPLSGIDQAAVPGFVWQDGSIWFLLGWMDRAAKKLPCVEKLCPSWAKIKTRSSMSPPVVKKCRYLLHSHKLKSSNELTRLFRLLESFNLKFLLYLTTPVLASLFTVATLLVYMETM